MYLHCSSEYFFAVYFRNIRKFFQAKNISMVGVKSIPRSYDLKDHEIESELSFIKTKARGKYTNTVLTPQASQNRTEKTILFQMHLWHKS